MRRLLTTIGVLTLLAGCGSAGEPRSLVPTHAAHRPMPAGAVEATSAPEGGEQPECGDPTASLRPTTGTAVPAGSTMAKIRNRGRLVVGVDQNTNLFGFRNPATGKLQGFDVDMAREIADALFGDPDKVQLVTMPVQHRIDALKNHEVDLVIFTMTITCDRWEEINFSTVYFEAGQRVLVRKGSGIGGLADLGGKPVCAPHGSTSSVNVYKANPRPKLVETNNMADCLVLLQQGQVQAVSTDDSVLAGLAEQDPTTEVVGGSFSSEPYGIGIPKDQTDLVRYVNAVLDDVRDGAWQQSYNRWLEPALGPARPPAPSYK